jgi:hypothetical protein
MTNKAAQDPKHRFGGLYRLLNHDSLRECFYALRKDAAPGVDGMTFKEYEKNLESNLADLALRGLAEFVAVFSRLNVRLILLRVNWRQ